MAGKRKYSLPALFLPLIFFCPILRHVTTTVSNKPTDCESAGGLLNPGISSTAGRLRGFVEFPCHSFPCHSWREFGQR